MSDEIELISDCEGLAVIGEKAAVWRFLRQQGLLAVAEDLSLRGLSSLAGTADAVFSNFSGIAEKSAKWVKLTDESAERIREFGLMESKIQGVSHAMIGDPGSISKWLQIDTSAGAVLTNPAVLAGAAGVMAQMARQREMRQIKAYLAQIDSKVSEVLLGQKHEQLSRLLGTRELIEEAMAVREQQRGRIDSTTWSTLQDRVGALGDMSNWALLQLSSVAGGLEAAKPAERSKRAQAAVGDVEELLAVLAHCFELQDALQVMRLDRVLEESPGDVDSQRRALEGSRQKQRDVIRRTTARLVARVDEAAGVANSRVVLHARAAKGVTGAANAIATAVAQLQEPFDLDSRRLHVKTPRWTQAIRDGGQLSAAGKEAAPKAVLPVLVIGGAAMYVTPATRPLAVKAFEVARGIIK